MKPETRFPFWRAGGPAALVAIAAVAAFVLSGVFLVCARLFFRALGG